MDLRLKKAKQAIRSWIKQFSDQRLAEVYAANHDGKMIWGNGCSCLIGVTDESLPIHQVFCKTMHYVRTINNNPATSFGVESCYWWLGTIKLISTIELFDEQAHLMRQVRLSAILRAEIRLRDRQKQSAAIAKQIVEEIISLPQFLSALL